MNMNDTLVNPCIQNTSFQTTTKKKSTIFNYTRDQFYDRKKEKNRNVSINVNKKSRILHRY